MNRAVIRERHPLPTIEDVRHRLRGAKFFSKIDIKEAFYQLELDEESRPLTTFITQKGLYRYKRLMFGFSCAPEKFQKTIEQLLAPHPRCLNFLDDILVYTEKEEDHDTVLKEVLNTLRQYGVLLNETKSVFKVTKIEFLGHIFDADGVRPAESKVEAIQNFRSPQTKEELRSFLGLVNYLGSFIPDLGTKTHCLRELEKKDKFTWTSVEQGAFEELKAAVGNAETLVAFNPELETRLVADASPYAIGAVLIQFKNHKPSPIAYASKRLTDTERRYSQTEKEALALVWAVEKYRFYLLGISFELETDHKPLEAIFSPQSKPCMRIERWVLRLQAFSYRVVYRKGASNIADPLSRLTDQSHGEPFETESATYIRSVVEYAAIDFPEIEEANRNDEEMKTLREAVLKDEGWYVDTLKPYRAFRLEFCTFGGLILRGSRIVVPKALRARFLQLGHEGHPGESVMKRRLREKCWWPQMDSDIVKEVKNCEGCRLVSLPDPPEPMQRRKIPEAPWVDVAIDFLGPLPSGDYVLVIVDYYSRYMEVEFMRSITARSTIERLDPIFVRLGYPVTMTLDNARQFVSSEFEEYCAGSGIRLNKTTPYWPAANGEVERQNRSLLKRLRISHAQGQDWKKGVRAFLLMYNTSPHSTTGKTPTELLMGRTIRSKIPQLKDLTNTRPVAEFVDRDETRKDVGKETEDARRRAKPSSIDVGDKVLMKNLLPGNKLQPNFDPNEKLVVARKGSRVTVLDENSGRTYDRNTCHLKQVPEVDNNNPESHPMEVDDPKETSSVGADTRQSPRRSKRAPRMNPAFQDYVLH